MADLQSILNLALAQTVFTYSMSFSMVVISTAILIFAIRK